MQATHSEGYQGNALGLKQYTKDVPPGWNQGVYPVTEYFELLKVWTRLTRLDEEQVAAAVMSRLQGRALRLAHAKTVVRVDPATMSPVTATGVEAIILPATPDIFDQQTGGLLLAAQESGLKLFLDDLRRDFEVEDQDLAWIAID